MRISLRRVVVAARPRFKKGDSVSVSGDVGAVYRVIDVGTYSDLSRWDTLSSPDDYGGEDAPVVLVEDARGSKILYADDGGTVVKVKTTSPGLTGKEYTAKVRDALARAGLGRSNDSTRGGEVTGWVKPNQYGSLGFYVRAAPGGMVHWGVVVSGKAAGLRYREWEEDQGRDDDDDGDTITLHEPVNPRGAESRVADVVRKALGVKVAVAKYAGHSRHWDDDVEYVVTTERPPDLLDK